MMLWWDEVYVLLKCHSQSGLENEEPCGSNQRQTDVNVAITGTTAIRYSVSYFHEHKFVLRTAKSKNKVSTMWNFQSKNTLLQHEKLHSDELGSWRIHKLYTSVHMITQQQYLLSTVTKLIGVCLEPTLCVPLWVSHLPLFYYFATTHPSNTHPEAEVSLFHGQVLDVLENLCISTM